MILIYDTGEDEFNNFLYTLVEYCTITNSFHGGGRVWSDHYVGSHNIDKVLYSVVQYRKKYLTCKSFLSKM